MRRFSYHVRHVAQHKAASLMTAGGVALTTGVLCYLLSVADGLSQALRLSGDPHNVLVLAEHATAESNSAVLHDGVQRLAGLPGLARGPDGRAVMSPEYVVQTSVRRRGRATQAVACLVLRGVEREAALAVRPRARLVAGRWFEAGADEVVVGVAAARQFDLGWDPDERVRAGAGQAAAWRRTGEPAIDCGARRFTVVGVFTCGGGSHESELWGHAPNVGDAHRRHGYSSVTARLASSDPAALADLSRRVAGAGVALRAIHEPRYFASQAENADRLRRMTLGLVALMSAGAIFAATNAMSAAVAGRTREIGMLRALGFSARTVRFGILLESLAIALAGGLAGCAVCLAALSLDRPMRDMVGATNTFASIAFRVQPAGSAVAAALAAAAGIGLLGGFWPARQAERLAVVDALRTV